MEGEKDKEIEAKEVTHEEAQPVEVDKPTKEDRPLEETKQQEEPSKEDETVVKNTQHPWT